MRSISITYLETDRDELAQLLLLLAQGEKRSITITQVHRGLHHSPLLLLRLLLLLLLRLLMLRLLMLRLLHLVPKLLLSPRIKFHLFLCLVEYRLVSLVFIP